ncbi:hypothetical protein LUZ60_016912 [Juncus effusus]|nr:hypothetical protein LUZ60_016912 [Juncus effusus]
MASTTMSTVFYCDAIEYDNGPHHMLDSCSLCRKALSKNRDIFMYRGDTPFCSEECRQEQMEIDHEKELRRKTRKNRKERKALRQEDQCDSQRERIVIATGAW